MKIILASQSPRRRELLTQMGLPFTVVTSQYEELLDDDRPVDEVALELAFGKALDVARRHPDAYVIGSDTIVSINGRQLAKPADAAEAEAMLRDLAGRVNAVTTAVVVIHHGKNIQLSGVDSTFVHFKPYDAAAFKTYLASGDWADKAGAYGIQSGAAPLIEQIEGDYDTVIGLPTRVLADLLREIGMQGVRPVELTPPMRQILRAEDTDRPRDNQR